MLLNLPKINRTTYKIFLYLSNSQRKDEKELYNGAILFGSHND